MVSWCDYCAKRVRSDTLDGKTCCSLCGRVLAEDNFTEEATFVKTADGQSRFAGNLVRSTREGNSERTLNEALDGIVDMMYALGIDGGDDISNGTLLIYKKLLETGSTRGRRKEQVQASCLYMMCRLKNKPYLLIDFSEHLRINVYVLGAVFLQLCKILRLDQNPVLLKLADPSLFIHRFADRLFGSRNQNVSKTALHIVASMKRDWMQTGRKPSGLCGAALYISALAHGLKCSKSEIIKAVHVCEATLTKRLIEFENTDSGGLTIEEFEKKSKEFDDLSNMFGKDKSQMKSLNTGQIASGSGELLCEHKGSGTPQFAYGLCSACYSEFMKLSGGLDGGLEPPAFQHAERKRIMAKEAASDISQNLDSTMLPGLTGSNSTLLNSDEQRSIKNTIENDVIQPAYSDSTGATLQSRTIHDTNNDRMDADDFTLEESESLSDIDDTEVDVYINTEEEKNLKTTVWEEINREYLEEQAAKEAATLAAKKAFEAKFSNCSEDVETARKLAAAAAAAVAQSRKEKRQKRAAELKSYGPPQTAAEAAKQMLDKTGLSSRFRQDKMDEMFKSDDPSPKKIRTEPEPEDEDDDIYEEDPELEVTEDAYGDYREENNYDEDYDDL
ncbi:hypothetical protein C2S51_010650 [Perilla frutescens var. frutescens]|nr:hypothetical protein C2S51_010650 [Perilla frutescens var. frutescens]